MAGFIIGLLGISIVMSAVIALMSAVSKGMRQNFASRARYVIWLLIVARLAVPVGAVFVPTVFEIPVAEREENNEISESSPSTENAESAEVTERIPDKQKPTQTDKVTPPETSLNEGGLQTGAPILSETDNDSVPTVPQTPPAGYIGHDTDSPTPESTVPQEESEIKKPVNTPKEENNTVSFSDRITDIAFFVWAFGALLFFVINLCRYALFVVQNSKTTMPETGTALAVYKELCLGMRIKRAPALYKSIGAGSPYCIGYLKRRIILPDIELSEDQLRYVLSHELYHHKRLDLWAKLLALFANAVHWFNPFVYIAVERFDREMEQSCDEAVLRGLTEEEQLSYGKAMLDIAKECSTACALTTGFNPKKKAVGECIDNILDTGKKKRRGIIIICAVAVLCIVSGLIIGSKVIGKGEDGKDDPNNQTEQTDKEETENQEGKEPPSASAADYPVVLWSADGVKLCAKNEEDKRGGADIPVVLLVGDDVISFKASYIFHVNSSTDYYNTDITGDGVKDHVLILPTDSGTGVSEEALYAFNGKDLAEIPVEDPLAFINSQMTFTGDDEYYYVLHYGKEIFKLPKKVFSGIEEEWIFEKPLVDSEIIYYYVSETENGASSISVEYFVSVAKGNFGSLGDAQVSFSYSGNELKCKEVSFVPFHGIATSNAESWTVMGAGSDIVITDGDTVISLDEEDGLENFHSSSTKNSLTATFDGEEKKCLLTYYDRTSDDKEVRMMCAALVDLEKGEVVAEYAPTFANILSVHGASTEDAAINDYLKDGVRLYHRFSAYEIYDGRFQIYSYIKSDDERVSFTGYTVIENTGESGTYIAVGASLPVDTSDVFEILDELRDMDGVPSHLATAATAFVNKDTMVLENHLGCMYGVLEDYKDFEFGNYSFSYSDDVLKLHIEIQKSSLTTVPVGEYTVEFCQGRFADVTMSGIGAKENHPISDESSTKAERLTENWLERFGFSGIGIIEEINNYNESYDGYNMLVLSYIGLLANIDNSQINSVEEYKKAAKDIFGIDNLVIPERFIDEEGRLRPWGFGGRVYSGTIFPEEREGNTILVKVQSYADFSCTVESHLYEFKYEDHGDYLKLVSIEIIKEGKYEPEDRYMA